MPGASESAFTDFSPFEPHDERLDDKHDSPFEFTFEEHFEDFHKNIQSKMAGAGSPFIKAEPNDFHFNPNQFAQGNFNMGSQQHNFNMNGSANIDPTQLQGGSYNGHGFGQSMSNSFTMGGSGIADDELEGLTFGGNGQHAFSDNSGMTQQQNYYNGGNVANGIPMSMPQQSMTNFLSSTPTGEPIQSPFVKQTFNYDQFQQHNVQQPQNLSMAASTGFANNLMRAHHMQNMERKISESRSPASPHTPGINGLHIGEPQFPIQNLQQQQQRMNHRHSTGMTQNWDSTPAGHSWTETSPFASPANGHQAHHPQISEVLGSSQGKVASSLPAKMEPGMGGSNIHQTQEAKKRRRRESHNLVERRRRDNINERIHDLANLIPHHRLEDEKVRKHLQTNSPLSPSVTAASMSPPQSASLLGTSNGRRASGSITQGLPLEDKDKGPNKGDILNGSVAWSRDVVWYLHMKMQQEAQLEELLSSLGQEWPFERNEDEKRMRSEILEVVERNVRLNGSQSYSRAHGSGLRVPGFTNVAGDPLSRGEGGHSGYASGQAMSPNFQGSGNGQQQSWQYSVGDHFKEEDEFDEDMS